MNIDIKLLQDKLCGLMCADITVSERHGRVIVSTPFLFADGDPYIFYLEELSAGLLRLSDCGHTLMHLSYENDIDKFRQGTRQKLFEQIINSGGVVEKNGELYIDLSADELGTAIFRFSQTLTSINDLTFLNKVRVESTFYEDLFEILERIVGVENIQKDYIYPELQNAKDYPIDYRIEGKNDPLFLFGIPNRDKARLATIVLERLLRANVSFDSVLIFADQGSLPRGDVARLSNVGGEMVASLDAHEDLRRKIGKRAALSG